MLSIFYCIDIPNNCGHLFVVFVTKCRESYQNMNKIHQCNRNSHMICEIRLQKMTSYETVIVDGEPVYDLKIEGEISDQSERDDLQSGDYFTELCRLCANPKGEEGKHIFNSGIISEEIIEMLKLVMPGKIDMEDGLTHFVCLECLDKLRLCYETIVVFLTADGYFKSQMEELAMREAEENEEIYEENVQEPMHYEVGRREVSTRPDLKIKKEIVDTVPQRKKTNKHSLIPKRSVLEIYHSLKKSQQHCQLCSQVFDSFTALIIHRRKKHKKSLATKRTKHFQCRNCPLVYTTLKALQLHMRSKYLQEKKRRSIITCTDCGLKFKRKYLLRAHKREAHKSHICTACGEAFYLRKSLAIHAKQQHSDTTCSVCGKKFKTSYWKIMHEKTHQTDNCYLCWICGKVCISKTSLRTHISLHSSKKSYACDVCNKELKSASGLKHHKEIHTDRERLHKCNICDKAFTSNVILKQHGLSHSGLKPYACTNCGTQFNRLSNLNYHIKHYCALKKPVKPKKRILNPTYQCDICKSKFVSKLSYKYHLSRHNGNKNPFDCEECEMVFSSVSSYRQHKRAHANERPYVCETCGKTFKTKGTLNVHSATHNNVFPYKCLECNRSFKRSSSLNLHQATHTGTKPFRCGICFRSFTRRGDVKTHLTRCHKIAVINGEAEALEYKVSEVVIDGQDSIDFPIVAGEYVIQMGDDVEVETTYETI